MAEFGVSGNRPMVTRIEAISHIPVRKKVDVTKKSIILNFIILLLLIFTKYNIAIGFIGGLVLISYLSLQSLIKPRTAFFTIFGVKLTFDTLWFIRLPGYESYGMLHLILIPILILVLIGPKVTKRGLRWPLWFAFIYLIWISLAMIVNNVSFEFDLILRQSGIFIGIVAGYKYLRDFEDFNMLARVIFISTIIPILASLIQIIMGPNAPYFYYTLDTIRDYRYAGLYYDAATAGMVNILSLGSNLYLLYVGVVKKKYIKYHIAFIPISMIVILSGGTRSIIITSSFILLIFLSRNVKKTLIIIPLLLIVLFLGQSYIDKVVKRSAFEIHRKVEVSRILQDTEYRSMFTGRVSIWQDIWEGFKMGTFQQQLFGSGLSSNAHSSYFFLLLQIGYLGLFFYISFHVFLFLALFRRKVAGTQKIIALLCLCSVLMIGFSAATVTYTSFQWIIYLIVGGTLSMRTSTQYEQIRT